ncbi:MAG: YqeG family HAD IIIA-type phosphatase [Sulfobacillus sp.]
MKPMSAHGRPIATRTGFRPGQQVRHVSAIDVESLRQGGIRMLLIDFDNTLIARHEARPSAAVLAWLERARQAGIEAVVFSNNRSRRVNRIASELRLRCFTGVGKPSLAAYRTVLHTCGQTPATVVAIGDQVFRDIWGANRSGVHSILVEPLDRREFLPIRLIRPIERLVLAALRDRQLRNVG